MGKARLNKAGSEGTCDGDSDGDDDSESDGDDDGDGVSDGGGSLSIKKRMGRG